MSQISRVRSMRSWPSSVGIRRVAGMASRVVVWTSNYLNRQACSPTSPRAATAEVLSRRSLHGLQCWALGDHRVARGLPRSRRWTQGARCWRGPRRVGRGRLAPRRRSAAGGSGRAPVGAVGACARARTGRSARPGGGPRSSCGCGPRPTSASPAGRAMPHWLMHVAAVPLGDAEDVGRVDRVPAAQVARAAAASAGSVGVASRTSAPLRRMRTTAASRRAAIASRSALGRRMSLPPPTIDTRSGRSARAASSCGPDDVGEQPAAHGEVGVGEVVRRPRGRGSARCDGEPVGPADVRVSRASGPGRTCPR